MKAVNSCTGRNIHFTASSTLPRRSSRLQAPGPSRDLPQTSTSARSQPPSAPESGMEESQTYNGIMQIILDAADKTLGLSPITHELEVAPKLRLWIEELSKNTSPSDLRNVLNDMQMYINLASAGLGTVIDPERENKLWEMEMRKMGVRK